MDKGSGDEGTKHDENLSDWSDESYTTEDSESSSNSVGGEFVDVLISKMYAMIPPSIRYCKIYSKVIDRKMLQVLSKEITIKEFEDFIKQLKVPSWVDEISKLKVCEPLTIKEIKIKGTDILGSFPGICQNKGILMELTKILDWSEDKDISKYFEILIKRLRLNYLIMNLNTFLKGYELLVFDYENIVERSFGIHSYSDGVMDHIDNGVIPYEILDKLLESRIPLIYDGYLFVRIKSFVNIEKDFGFYPLQHSNETIDGICDMVAHQMSYDSKKMKKIKSQLYVEIFPNLFLSPKPIQKVKRTLNFCSGNLRRILDDEVEKRLKVLNHLTEAYADGCISSLSEETVLEFLHHKKRTKQITSLMDEIKLSSDEEEVKEKITDDEDKKMFFDHLKKQEGKLRGEQFRESRNDIEIGHLVDMPSTSSKGVYFSSPQDH